MPPPVTRPGPVTLTVSGTLLLLNVAVTLFAVFMTIVQFGFAPPQAPLQPLKPAPVAGVAARETVVPTANLAEHVSPLLPQLTAPPTPLTFPLPDTATRSSTTGENVAVTDLASPIRTMQVAAVPEHPPPQPVNVLPSAAVAVRSTLELTA